LTRDLKPPPWTRLVHADPRVARGVLDGAARADSAFVRRLLTTWTTEFGPAGQHGGSARTLDRAALLLTHRRLFLYDLGAVPLPPRPAVEALRQTPGAMTSGALRDDAPAPAGLAGRMLVVIENMSNVPPGELGRDAAELLALLATAGAAGRLATVLAVWAASHLTGAGWAIDAGLILYGLWAVGAGILDILCRLLTIVHAVQGARTVGALRRQSRPLAKLLIEAGITVMVAFFLKGLKSRTRPQGETSAPEPPANKPKPTPKPAPSPPKPPPQPPKPPEPMALSKSKFGHTFTTYGQEQTEFLTKRAAGSGMPQGQFLDDQKAARFIQGNLDQVRNGAASLSIPDNVPARVIMPDGSFAKPNFIRLVPGGNGVKTAYP